MMVHTLPRLSIGVEYRSDSGLGELIRMRLAYKGSNETISSDILETVFYSWSETWYEPGTNTVPTHIHAVMISFHFTPTQASVKDFLPAQGSSKPLYFLQLGPYGQSSGMFSKVAAHNSLFQNQPTLRRSLAVHGRLRRSFYAPA